MKGGRKNLETRKQGRMGGRKETKKEGGNKENTERTTRKEGADDIALVRDWSTIRTP